MFEPKHQRCVKELTEPTDPALPCHLHISTELFCAGCHYLLTSLALHLAAIFYIYLQSLDAYGAYFFSIEYLQSINIILIRHLHLKELVLRKKQS